MDCVDSFLSCGVLEMKRTFFFLFLFFLYCFSVRVFPLICGGGGTSFRLLFHLQSSPAANGTRFSLFFFLKVHLFLFVCFFFAFCFSSVLELGRIRSTWRRVINGGHQCEPNITFFTFWVPLDAQMAITNHLMVFTTPHHRQPGPFGFCSFLHGLLHPVVCFFWTFNYLFRFFCLVAGEGAICNGKNDAINAGTGRISRSATSPDVNQLSDVVSFPLSFLFLSLSCGDLRGSDPVMHFDRYPSVALATKKKRKYVIMTINRKWTYRAKSMPAAVGNKRPTSILIRSGFGRFECRDLRDRLAPLFWILFIFYMQALKALRYGGTLEMISFNRFHYS